MSFTQENEINIKKCNGCEKHCAFGVKCEKTKTMHDGKLVIKEFMYPSLAGKAIKSYRNKIGIEQHPGYLITDNTVILDGVPKKIDFETRLHMTKEMLEYANLISRLCDHYKTR